jgi:hypothetical protein
MDQQAIYIGEVDSPGFATGPDPEAIRAHQAEVAAHDKPLEHSASDQAAQAGLGAVGAAVIGGGLLHHEVISLAALAGEGAAAATELVSEHFSHDSAAQPGPGASHNSGSQDGGMCYEPNMSYDPGMSHDDACGSSHDYSSYDHSSYDHH